MQMVLEHPVRRRTRGYAAKFLSGIQGRHLLHVSCRVGLLVVSGVA